jgi:two-component system sensor histidine kinase/response regulator
MVVTYQPILVMLAAVVGIFGSITALTLTSGSHDAESESWEASFALANGGLIMGTTIWSMHFIAMMAVEFPTLINYNIVETILSICFAMAATALGLYVVSKKRLGRYSIIGGGVAMGLGIASMHYTGMSAIRGCGLSYDLILVGASVAIAIVASMAALWFAFYKRTIWTTLAAGVVQGVAIASMHFTAMAATSFWRLNAPANLTIPLFGQELLALMIASAMIVVCIGNLTLAGLMTLQKRSAA